MVYWFPRRPWMESYDNSALCIETLFYTLNAGVSHVLKYSQDSKVEEFMIQLVPPIQELI